jgi:serine/threonine protein kinase
MILVVDDDVWSSRLIAALLEKAGYDVLCASDPRRCLPLVDSLKPALVILDQNMPGQDGLSVLEELRRVSAVPVVMLTAHDRSDLAVRALRLGAFDYLTKPVDEDRLARVVGEAIQDVAGRLRQYRIEAEIGRGGMGVVYRAHDTRLDRPVALKVLLPELAADPEFEAAFLREARHAAPFCHPNIVTVFDAGRHAGRLYIAMQLVDGVPLSRYVTGPEALPAARVLHAGIQIADALAAVHAAGLLHRDLKPGNLMLAGDVVKVLDFGLAHPVGAAAVAGTLPYAPPEVLESGRCDVRGDVYSLGVVLYELLARRIAFAAPTQFETMKKVAAAELPVPWSELRAEGVDVVRRMMSLDPKDRPASMAEVASALRAYLAPKTLP